MSADRLPLLVAYGEGEEEVGRYEEEGEKGDDFEMRAMVDGQVLSHGKNERRPTTEAGEEPTRSTPAPAPRCLPTYVTYDLFIYFGLSLLYPLSFPFYCHLSLLLSVSWRTHRRGVFVWQKSREPALVNQAASQWLCVHGYHPRARLTVRYQGSRPRVPAQRSSAGVHVRLLRSRSWRGQQCAFTLSPTHLSRFSLSLCVCARHRLLTDNRCVSGLVVCRSRSHESRQGGHLPAVRVGRAHCPLILLHPRRHVRRRALAKGTFSPYALRSFSFSLSRLT